jgi:hypothetical protein
MCVDRAVLLGMMRPRPGPRLHRTHALCGPCVNRKGISPAVCGRRTLAELHIQDIGPRMLPPYRAPGRRASCRHPCCSFPRSSLRAHSTLYSPGCGKHLYVLCTPNPKYRRHLHKKRAAGEDGEKIGPSISGLYRAGSPRKITPAQVDRSNADKRRP